MRGLTVDYESGNFLLWLYSFRYPQPLVQLVYKYLTVLITSRKRIADL